MSKIKSEVQAVIDAIGASETKFEQSKNKGTMTQSVPVALVADQLPDNLKELGGMDVLEQFQAARDNTIVPAFTHGLAVSAAEAMKADSEIEQVVSSIPFGSDSINFRQKRSMEVLAGISKEGEERKTKTVYGKPANFNYQAKAVQDKGQLKVVKTEVADVCEALLKDN